MLYFNTNVGATLGEVSVNAYLPTTTCCGWRPLAGLAEASVLIKSLKRKELPSGGWFTYWDFIGSQLSSKPCRRARLAASC